MELRLKVYDEVLVIGKIFFTPQKFEYEKQARFKDWELYRKPELQLLRVCKIIHQEAEKVYLLNNLFVLPTELYSYSPFSTHLPHPTRHLFSKEAFRYLKNISVGFSPVPDDYTTSSFVDFERTQMDKGIDAVYDRLEATSARIVQAHKDAYFDVMTGHFESINVTLSEPPFLFYELHYVEIDYTNAVCPLGCCKWLSRGTAFLDDMCPKKTVVLGLTPGGEEELWLNGEASKYTDDEGEEDDWGTVEWVLQEYGVEFSPEEDE